MEVMAWRVMFDAIVFFGGGPETAAVSGEQ
jgi:hypothetical protein